MKIQFSTIIAILLTTAVAACSTMEATQSGNTPTAMAVGGQVQEIMPGMLQGYLTKEQQLDSKEFVLPSPAEDSTRQTMDTAWADNLKALRGTARWDLAKSDADLAFPAAARTFTCALGIPVTEQDTPALYMLLRRTLTDIGLAPYSLRAHCHRLGLGVDPDRAGTRSRRGNPCQGSLLRREPQCLQRALVYRCCGRKIGRCSCSSQAAR